ncbi:hypothetical protein IMCC3317_12480 [Kordia antarctica]|uniref:4Fe4S-binding SPASM domain-containing protein n=1 Tax=Kordia antarctica TaxID=1218801 RepID=A0A7L4ZH91_9FLAO|nr:grasp-with-spasm system SPASM domain peptide maturase [Kordia antarctica]QHI35900.1 hypothetical protein IMCC3317_12480 [Kordia antarctica]
MIDQSLYVNLFAGCIPVQGAKNVIICDLQRGVYFEIDIILHEILINHAEKNIKEIISNFGIVHEQDILDQLTQLLQNDLIHLTNEKELFPKLDTKWQTPSAITNMIIEYGNYFKKRETEIIQDLITLGVQYLELRFYSECSMDEVSYVLNCLRKTKIAGIYLILPDLPVINVEEFLVKNPRIMGILLTDAQDPKRFESQQKIAFSANKICNNQNCGTICKELFRTNYEVYMESQEFNSCLNKKLAILENGNIKNCPSMPEVLGHIDSSRLTEVLKKPEATKYWNITKDQIDVCKECEFRYICTDCRAYVENPKDMLSKPLKCGYNPYTGEWSDWTLNPLKQKAIDFYDMRKTVQK